MDNFSSDLYLVTRQSGASLGMFDEDEVTSSVDNAAFGLLSVVSVDPGDFTVVAFSIVDDEGVLDETFSAEGYEALAGPDLDLGGNVTLEAEFEGSATVSGVFSSTMFPSDWLMCGDDLMRTVTGAEEAEYNFAIVADPTESQLSSLEADGFVVQPVIAILEFLESGVQELQTDAYLVLLPSTFVVGVLVYSFLGSEVVDRRREIGILKTIGAGRRRLFSYLLTNALLITAWGAALGLALGIILSYAIATVASHMFTSVFVIEIEEVLLVVAYGATVAAGLAGTMIPAIRSTYSSPVQDLKEVGRF